ncbi:MAG: hypothetical protein P4L51_06045 [Puia sp.]|nr:hypothetical protein [Puia sp.]
MPIYNVIFEQDVQDSHSPLEAAKAGLKRLLESKPTCCMVTDQSTGEKHPISFNRFENGMANIAVGDQVYFSTPGDGRSSGIYQVEEINDDTLNLSNGLAGVEASKSECVNLLGVLRSSTARMFDVLAATRDALCGAGLWTGEEPFMILIDNTLDLASRSQSGE